MYDESTDARNTTAVAISTGCPGLPIGVVVPKFSSDSLPIVAGGRGAHTGPGATALTRIERFPTIWFDSARVNATIAPLVEL